MQNTLIRYLVALLAVPAILYVLIALPPWSFHILVSAIMMMVLVEWLQLIGGLKLASPLILGLTLGAVQLTGVYTFAVSQDGKVLYFTTMLVILGLSAYSLVNQAFDIKQRSTGNGSMLMAIMMSTWGGGSLILLREIEAIPDGRFWILMLFAIAWLGDTGAMHFGKLLGKHKLSPVISPKKTIEGLIAGILTGTAAGFAVYYGFDFNMPFWHLFIIGPLVVCFAHIGDLTASMTKRAARVKDSSKLIPGHGGYLDRFDNLLLSTPFIYLYIQYILK